MGASLGPVLANIIKMECEKVIIDNLVDRFETETPHFFYLEIYPNGLIIFRKTPTLDSTLRWTPLLCGNGKRPGSNHLQIEQRKYFQKKTFQRNSN